MSIFSDLIKQAEKLIEDVEYKEKNQSLIDRFFKMLDNLDDAKRIETQDSGILDRLHNKLRKKGDENDMFF